MKTTIRLLMVCFMATMAHGDGEELFKQGAAVFKSDPVQAYLLFEQAAEEENVSAMVGAGHCLENGIGTEIDFAAAIAWYEKAALQNNLKACEGLARIYASCPDPQFHDGAKAVQYAEALVRKSPKDSEALVLLAAAYARNMDFQRAGSAIKRVLHKETRTAEVTRLEELQVRYQGGTPTPALATEEWVIHAAHNGSFWAAGQAVRRMSDRFDPLYDPAGALALCMEGINAGNSALYVPLGNLYLDAEDLDMAYESFLKAREEYREGTWGGPLPIEVNLCGHLKETAGQVFTEAKKYRTGWTIISVSGKYDEVRINSQNRRVIENGDLDFRASYNSEEELKAAFPSWSPGSNEITASQYNRNYRLRVYSSKGLPNLQASLFLVKVAAKKGDMEAAKELEAMKKSMNHYREILANKADLSNSEVAAAVNEEALKFCSSDAFPANLPLAEELYTKSYELVPSPRTACILGMLYLRDCLNFQDYTSRPVDEAVAWLETAHSGGYLPATRRLAELYACDADAEVCNGELAVKYANAYLEVRPPGDHEALQVLAVAYARNEQVSKAREALKQAMKSYKEAEGKRAVQYERQRQRLNKGEPLSMYKHISESQTFAILVQGLSDA